MSTETEKSVAITTHRAPKETPVPTAAPIPIPTTESALKQVADKVTSLPYEQIGPSCREYENILATTLEMPIYRMFVRRLYADAKTKVKDECGCFDPRSTRDLRYFQEALRDSQKWGSDKIASVCKEITQSAPDFPFQQVLKLIFVMRSMLLSMVGRNSKKEKIQISVPALEKFLQRCMLKIARQLFSDPAMMRELPEKENKLLRMVNQSVRLAITDLLPVAKIVDHYLTDTLNSFDYDAVPTPATAKTQGGGDEFGFSKSDDEADDAGLIEESESESEYESETEYDDDEEEEEEEEVKHYAHPPQHQQQQQRQQQQFHRGGGRGYPRGAHRGHGGYA